MPERPNPPPVITVSGNAPEGDVVYGTMVDLVATCNDREEGAIGTVRWTSDRGDWLADEVKRLGYPINTVRIVTTVSWSGCTSRPPHRQWRDD